MSRNIKKICWGVLGVAVFYVLLQALAAVFLPFFMQLYLFIPFVFFAPIAFFFTMFLARETACAVFMPKPRLKAVIRDGQAEVSASQVVLKVFSWAFLKRIAMYFGLFVLELVCRIAAIRLFLMLADVSLSGLAAVADKSEMLLIVLVTLAAFAVMELPWYALFYRVGFGGRANRSSEYRFGLKAFVFMLGVLLIQVLMLPLSMRYESDAAQYGLLAVLVVLGTGLWALMYKKQWKKASCPICNRIKSCIEKYKKPKGMRDKNEEPQVVEKKD